MNQPRNTADSDLSARDDQRVRELELELIKTQAEAKAARLEARAAELELMIRQMTRTAESTESQSRHDTRLHVDDRHQAIGGPVRAAPATEPSSKVDGATTLAGATLAGNTFAGTSDLANRDDVSARDDLPDSETRKLFSSWDEIRQAAGTIEIGGAENQALDQNHNGNDSSNDWISRTDRRGAPARVTPSTVMRFDSAHATDPPRPKSVLDFDRQVKSETVQPDRPSDRESGRDSTADVSPADVGSQHESSQHESGPESSPQQEKFVNQFHPAPSPSVDASRDVEGAGIEGVDVEENESEQNSGRSRPAALMASLFAHIAILLLLAAFTLTPNRPKDQVALSASTSENDEPTIETISIETAEPETSEVEPTPSETQYDVSELGEMKITELKPADIAGPPAPPLDSPLSSQAMSAAMSMKSNSESSMQFCGVEGGGNHFVYLVDSSGSMGSAFESARAELLDSIRQLKPDQRFYVVFFDAQPDYMRLTDPDEDEPRSVVASPDNIRALQRWAMSIKMDRGKAPFDPLKFAVGLQPDVIFLLSDGEFPQGIEDLLQEINQFDNLFGDEGPISLVHTIGYHSREGETRMKRIAKQNGGQYRHVPKP